MIDLDARTESQNGSMQAELALDPAAPRTRRDAEARARALVDGHFDRVWRFLRRLALPDDAADDAAQQVFAIAAQKLDVIAPGGELPYLFGIAVRVAAESKRVYARRSRELVADAGALPEATVDTPPPDELLDQKRARALLDEIVASMPMDVRAVFVAIEIEGMSAPEIAEVLAIPLGTVASRLRRGREQFQAAAARVQRSRRER